MRNRQRQRKNEYSFPDLEQQLVTLPDDVTEAQIHVRY